MMLKIIVVSLLGLAVGAPAYAEPYWIAWEGDAFPETQGWERVWGDWQGQYHGVGAYRTIQNGVMTMDSLYDPGVYDFAHMERPGEMDPGPGELFVMEWRLYVEQTVGVTYDADIAVVNDAGWIVAFGVTESTITGGFEQFTIDIAPEIFHDYRFVSEDMKNYALYVDGEFVRS